MLTSLATSAAGLRHSTARQRATAHDTANLATPDTAVLRAEGRQDPAGQGVTSAVTAQLERRPAAAPAPRTRDVVELSAGQIATVHAARANAVAVRTADAMLGTLLDASDSAVDTLA